MDQKGIAGVSDVCDAHRSTHDNEHVAFPERGGHKLPQIEPQNVHVKPSLSAQIGDVSRTLSVEVLENDGPSHVVLSRIIR